MDEFKGRWQALQSEDAGSRLVGGALARSVGNLRDADLHGNAA